MVDPTNGIGNIQNIQPTSSRSADTAANREKKTESTQDSVEVSEDAQILGSLTETRDLVANSNQPLGLDAGFVKKETN